MNLCQEKPTPPSSPDSVEKPKAESEPVPAEETVVLGGAPKIRQRGELITKQTITSRCCLNPKTGCWEWTRAKHRHGYGELRSGKSGVRASRVAYELWKGKIPDGMEVMHKCDNPPCCNPDHLVIGSHTENMRDAKAKGRVNSKITQQMADRIRVDPRPYKLISEEYLVSAPTISMIKTGKRWATKTK